MHIHYTTCVCAHFSFVFCKTLLAYQNIYDIEVKTKHTEKIVEITKAKRNVSFKRVTKSIGPFFIHFHLLDVHFIFSSFVFFLCFIIYFFFCFFKWNKNSILECWCWLLVVGEFEKYFLVLHYAVFCCFFDCGYTRIRRMHSSAHD